MRLHTKFQASRTILQLELQLEDTCPGGVGGWLGGTDSDYRANLSSTETAVELQLELSLAIH